MTELSRSGEAHKGSHHVVSLQTYFLVYVALVVLLAATVLASEMPFSRSGHLYAAMAISAIKTILIALIFMHVYYSAPLTWITAVGTLMWVALMIGFVLVDYGSRTWIDILGKWPAGQ